MKTKKLCSSILAVFIVLTMFLSLPVSADSIKVGTDIGDAVETNIKASINNNLIPTMVINNQVAIEIRYLASYGFDVLVNSQTKEIRINTNLNKKISPVVTDPKLVAKLGRKLGDVLTTDIKVFLNGAPVDCYSLNGYTVVVFDKFSPAGQMKWDNNTRTLSLTVNAMPTQSTNTAPINTAATPNDKLNVQEIVSTNDDKICLIEATDADGNVSQGSGILIKESLFLTNYHVVDGAKSAKIKLMNGNTYDAEGLVVYDEKLDLAVLKINEKTNIAPVALGPLSEIKKGQHAVAIGSPKGLQNTVSEGIVSNLFTEDGYTFIQISVPVTHGSSGGALFNDKGQVIGVTTAAMDHGTLDINFAVPVEYINNWMKNELSKDTSTLAASFPAKTQAPPTASKALTISELQTELQNGYSTIPTSIGDFDLFNWTVYEEDGIIFILANLDPDQYYDYVSTYSLVSEEIMEWAKETGSALDLYCPGKEVMMSVFYQEIFPVYPSVFESDEIYYQAEYQNWLVTHSIIEIYLDAENINWKSNF